MVILGIEAAAKVAGAAVLKAETSLTAEENLPAELSSQAGSGLQAGILAEEFTDGNLTHSQTLMPMIHRVLEKAGISLDQVDLITLTAGPGSFTGLRIGAATAKGLALGRARVDENGHMAGGIPILPLGTLESLCAGPVLGRAGKEELPAGDLVYVGTMDARRSQVYAACYDGALNPLISPEAMPPAALAEKLKALGRPCLFMGDAADLYETFFSQELGELYHKAPESVRGLRAGTSCLLALRKIRQAKEQGLPLPAIHGWELEIDYLRKPQAEREREERLARENAAAEQNPAGEGC